MTPATPETAAGDPDRGRGQESLDEPRDVAVTTTGIGTGTLDDFFKRGRAVAQALDAGQPITGGVRLTFECPEDLGRFLTPRRLAFYRAVREHPGTIGDLSTRLTRSRESLTRDLRLLESAGLVTTTRVTNPRDGWIDIIEPVSRGEVLLEARF